MWAEMHGDECRVNAGYEETCQYWYRSTAMTEALTYIVRASACWTKVLLRVWLHVADDLDDAVIAEYVTWRGNKSEKRLCRKG